MFMSSFTNVYMCVVLIVASTLSGHYNIMYVFNTILDVCPPRLYKECSRERSNLADCARCGCLIAVTVSSLQLLQSSSHGFTVANREKVENVPHSYLNLAFSINTYLRPMCACLVAGACRPQNGQFGWHTARGWRSSLSLSARSLCSLHSSTTTSNDKLFSATRGDICTRLCVLQIRENSLYSTYQIYFKKKEFCSCFLSIHC